MLVRLDRAAKLPLYVQIRQQLRELILSGALPPESRLPPTRDLAKALGVNRTTVVTAYRQLWSAGLVEGRAGGGTVVARPLDSVTERGSPRPSLFPWEKRYTQRLQPFYASRMMRQIQQAPSDVIKFCLGVPPDGRTPVHVARDVLEEAIPRGMNVLQNAPYAGIATLRRLIAKRAELLGIRAAPSEVLVLSGRDQGMYLMAQALLDPGDTVAMEVPAHSGAIHTFNTCGASIAPVPMDEYGLRLEILEGVLARRQPKLLYTAPTFQNPTGSTMDLERRRAVLDLCQRYRTPILEEDPYHDLRYEGMQVAPIKAFDRHDHVVYLSTYSETFFPGLPLAWLIAPKDVIARLESLKACMGEFPSVLAQQVVYEFLQRRMEETENVISHYASRRNAMCAALEKHCVGLMEWKCPEGGFFVWAKLQGGLKADIVLQEALKEKVAFASGWSFFPDGNGGESELRLDFAGNTEDRIEQGIQRLGKALRRSLDEKFPHYEKPIPFDEQQSDPFILLTQSLHANL